LRETFDLLFARIETCNMHKLIMALLLTLSLVPSPGLAQDIYRAAAAQTPSGEPVDGFALSLTTKQPTVHKGTPILVIVELRNVSGGEQNAMFGSRHSNYAFQIKNTKTGQFVPANANNTFGLATILGEGRGWPVNANTSIFGPFRLDLLYSFTEPGTYTVQVTRGQNIINGRLVSMESNIITIAILQ